MVGVVSPVFISCLSFGLEFECWKGEGTRLQRRGNTLRNAAGGLACFGGHAFGLHGGCYGVGGFYFFVRNQSDSSMVGVLYPPEIDCRSVHINISCGSIKDG